MDGSNLGWLGWIVLGALAGWIASMIAGENGRQGWLGNIIVGIIGAFIGGFVFSTVTGNEIQAGLNPISLIVAVIGAVILLAILRVVGARGR
jgi:uncharacterized membrane protein YeaQ/YmgE (transglycosylase-associated protein family)